VEAWKVKRRTVRNEQIYNIFKRLFFSSKLGVRQRLGG
jgi:hypothetical protein